MNAFVDGMTKSDYIIADLMNALYQIERAASDPAVSRFYILGIAEMAQKMCNEQRERNSDGYFVVKHDL